MPGGHVPSSPPLPMSSLVFAYGCLNGATSPNHVWWVNRGRRRGDSVMTKKLRHYNKVMNRMPLALCSCCLSRRTNCDKDMEISEDKNVDKNKD